MALNKDGYKNQFHGTGRIGAETDSEGFLLTQDSERAWAGTKNISFNMANSDNDAQDNVELIGGIITLANGNPNTMVNNFTVKWSV